MTIIGILQIVVFFGIILALTRPVGLFMARVFAGDRTFFHPIFRPVEVLVYKVCGVKETEEQRWTQYTEVAPGVQPLRVPLPVRTDAPAGMAAAQSTGLWHRAGES